MASTYPFSGRRSNCIIVPGYYGVLLHKWKGDWAAGYTNDKHLTFQMYTFEGKLEDSFANRMILCLQMRMNQHEMEGDCR